MQSSVGMGIAWVSLLLLAALLAVGTICLVRGLRRGRSHPSCGRCGYDVTGSVGHVDRCPECGSAFIEAGIIPPSKGRNTTLLLAGAGSLLLFVVLLGGAMYARLSAIPPQAQIAMPAPIIVRVPYQAQPLNARVGPGDTVTVPPADTDPPTDPADEATTGADGTGE